MARIPQDQDWETARAGLIGQFLLTPDASFAPAGWTIRGEPPFVLCTHPAVPVQRLVVDGRDRGYVLGWAIDTAAGALVRGALESGPDLVDRLDRLGGRWVCLDLDPDRPRIRLDAGGSSPVVFDPDRRMAASSLSVLCPPPSMEPGSEVHELLRVEGGYFPFGLTAVPEVSRLLPDHELDLSTFETVRVRPRAAAGTAPPLTPEQGVEVIARTMRATGEALADEACLALAFTAGRDSRAVLACLRSILDRVTVYTVRRGAGYDEQIPTLIAKEIGVPIRFVDGVSASERSIDDYLFRTGYAFGRRSGYRHLNSHDVGPTCFELSGMAGEVGRGYFWGPRDEPSTPLGPEQLLHRLHLRPRPRQLEAAGRWLAGLPDSLTTNEILDLLYVEIRLGCWAAPQTLHTATVSKAAIWPFSHGEIYDAISRMPLEYRRSARLGPDIVRHEWPELLAYPFNQYVGWRSHRERVRLVVRSMGLGGRARSVARRLPIRRRR